MGNEPVPPLPAGHDDFSLWGKGNRYPVAHNDAAFNLFYPDLTPAMKREIAGFTCPECPNRYRIRTERCRPCNANAQAHKRVKALAQFVNDCREPKHLQVVHITLTFADSDIDKTLSFAELNTIAKDRFKRMRERSSVWKQHFDGGIYGFEATQRPNNLHPHIHVVAYALQETKWPSRREDGLHWKDNPQWFTEMLVNHGFGPVADVCEVYVSKWNPDTEEYEITHNGDCSGAVYYAVKYCTKKDSHNRAIRTVSKFGCLYGRKTQRFFVNHDMLNTRVLTRMETSVHEES